MNCLNYFYLVLLLKVAHGSKGCIDSGFLHTGDS